MKQALRVAARLAAVALAGLAAGAQAATEARALDCDPAGNQQQLNDCAIAGYRAADAALNSRYAELMKALPAAQRSALRSEQRRWLKGRDPACARQAKAYQGGSMRPMVWYACLDKATRQRTAALARWEARAA